MLRKTVFWLHLTAGLTAGIVVLIMSVTGVALTYQKQMTEWADRAYWPAAGPDGADVLPFGELVESVEAAVPDTDLRSVRLYSDPDAPAVVTTADGNLWVNRQTGETARGQSESIRSFFRVMTDWHRWLSDDTRTVGRAITGASNLAFLFIVLSGMYLWVPRRWSLSTLRSVTWFRAGLAGKARDFNWHNVFGFWTALPLILVVASGVVISYPWASNLVYTVTGTEAPVRRGPGRGASDGMAGNDVFDPPLAVGEVDMLLERVGEIVPRWRTVSFTLPRAHDHEVSFSVDTSFGGMPQARSTLVLDRRTGRLEEKSSFADQNRGQRARSWLRYVHTGEYYGVVGQTVAGVASLAGVFLVYTGVLLSLRRLRAWRLRGVESARTGTSTGT